SRSRRLPARARWRSRRIVRAASPSPRVAPRTTQESATAACALIGLGLRTVLCFQRRDGITMAQRSDEGVDGVVGERGETDPAVCQSLHLQPQAAAPAQSLSHGLRDHYLPLARESRGRLHLTGSVRYLMPPVKPARSLRIDGAMPRWSSEGRRLLRVSLSCVRPGAPRA